MISIPNSFRVANRLWQVKYADLPDAHGQADFDNATITLSSGLKGELLLHSFVHELLHAATHAMGWKKLNECETKIDALAGMLAQALTTSK